MRKVFFCLLVLSLLVGLFGCLPPRASNVTGVIYDSVTALPLAGAKIQIGRNSIVTNSYGEYSLMTSAGFKTVNVGCSGYQPQTFVEKVAIGSHTLDIYLDPTADITITGRIFKGMTPLPNRPVDIFSTTTGLHLDTVHTDATGAYIFTVPVDEYYRVEVRGDVTKTDEVEFADFQDLLQPATTDIVLPDVDICYDWGANLTVTPGTYIYPDHQMNIGDFSSMGLNVDWSPWTPGCGTIIEYSFEVQDNMTEVVRRTLDPLTTLYRWDGYYDDGTYITTGNYEWIIGYRVSTGWKGHMHQHVKLHVQ